MRTIYLDYSATTFVREEVLSEMLPYFSEKFGNPSSMHRIGREARRALDDSREKVAHLLRVKPTEIVFTGGGSEADNLAIKGTAWALREKGNHIITSQIEHHAVLNTCKWLQKQGFRVSFLPVDKEGFVDLDALKSQICDQTILVSIMAGNNEVGTIQDIPKICEIAHAHGVAFHTDAVQYSPFYDLQLDEIPIAMASLSAHKFYGPKGVGLLFLREGTKLEPLIHGGSQEWDMRAGTENVAGIVGMSKALELNYQERAEVNLRLNNLREELISGILSQVPRARLNGPRDKRLPNNANISFEGASSELILLGLDRVGVCASAGSACASGSIEPSHVLTAMGLSPELVKSSVRFSLGIKTRKEDVQFVLENVAELAERAVQASRAL